MYEQGHLRLTSMMGSYPKTAALKSGEVRPQGAEFHFAPIEVAQQGFKAMVRELKYDVSEVAIVTFLLAFAAGKPYRLLPFVMNGQFHHKSLLRRADDPIQPRDLAGRKVAMRSYSQTTPTWVRGILSDSYGLDVRAVQWLSQEGAHVAEYADPAWVAPLAPGRKLEDLLIAGEVDAIIAGGGLSGDPAVQPMIADPEAAAQRWHKETGVVPINHMVAVRQELVDERPDLVRGVYEALVESRKRADGDMPAPAVELQPYGFDAVEPALHTVIRYCIEQGLIPAEYSTDELFGGVRKALA